ncbi:hypothetical protein EDD85DRAFT_798141 [Armillaria nabsnona]|nr:hypothetical protein EDD85DRAFT_798141 [Armillaria nabsnona]
MAPVFTVYTGTVGIPKYEFCDKEDFMKDVNAVGRASDEDTGRPSEPTKRSKNKAKKDKHKQKEIGDNHGTPPLYGISPADLLTHRSRAEKTLKEEDQEDNRDCSYRFKLLMSLDFRGNGNTNSE